MLKSIFPLYYFTGNRPGKSFFYNFRGPLLLTGWSYGNGFWSVLIHLSVLSKKCSFANLVNTMRNLNVKVVET